MSYQQDNGIQEQDHKQKTLTIMCKMLGLPIQNDTDTDEACPYCRKFHYTLKQCWLRKSDETLKDEVNTLIPSLKKVYKAQQDLLQQKGKFTIDQGKMMKSILRTLHDWGKYNGNTDECQSTQSGGDKLPKQRILK